MSQPMVERLATRPARPRRSLRKGKIRRSRRSISRPGRRPAPRAATGRTPERRRPARRHAPARAGSAWSWACRPRPTACAAARRRRAAHLRQRRQRGCARGSGAEQLRAKGADGLVSFGLAIGLAPVLRPGDVVIADSVVMPGGADDRDRSGLARGPAAAARRQRPQPARRAHRRQRRGADLGRRQAARLPDHLRGGARHREPRGRRGRRGRRPAAAGGARGRRAGRDDAPGDRLRRDHRRRPDPQPRDDRPPRGAALGDPGRLALHARTAGWRSRRCAGSRRSARSRSPATPRDARAPRGATRCAVCAARRPCRHERHRAPAWAAGEAAARRGGAGRRACAAACCACWRPAHPRRRRAPSRRRRGAGHRPDLRARSSPGGRRARSCSAVAADRGCAAAGGARPSIERAVDLGDGRRLVRLDRFGRDVERELRAALRPGATAVILDLRHNEGGLLRRMLAGRRRASPARSPGALRLVREDEVTELAIPAPRGRVWQGR